MKKAKFMLDRLHLDFKYHRPEEGVLFWGGPRHGMVKPQREDVMRRGKVRVPNRTDVRAGSWHFSDPINATYAIIPTVTYNVFKFASPVWEDYTADVWYVLLYAERSDRLLENLEKTVDSLMWLVAR